MVYFGIFLSLVIMSAMIFMALYKKSEFAVRVASLAALALMMLTVAICLFVALTDTRVPVDESIVIVGAPVEVKEVSSTSMRVLTLLIIFLVLLFLIVAIFSMREHKKNPPKDSGKGLTGLKSRF